MAFTVPEREPDTLTAGDLWTWSRSDLSDYPAPTWALTYSLVKLDKQIAITATTSGTGFLVSIAAATTADYSPGAYTWAAYATSGVERHLVGTGRIEVRPNLATLTQGYDGRSFAEIRVEQLELSIRARDPMMAAYSVGGRSVQYRTLEDVRTDLDYWRGRLYAERAKERVANGLQGARRLGVRL
jgi:hypothetical protein